MAHLGRQHHYAVGDDRRLPAGGPARPRRAARPDGPGDAVVPGPASAGGGADRLVRPAAHGRRPRVRHLVPHLPVRPAGPGHLGAAALPRAPPEHVRPRPGPSAVAGDAGGGPAGWSLRRHPGGAPRDRRRAGRGDDAGRHRRLAAGRGRVERPPAARAAAGAHRLRDGDDRRGGQRRQARRRRRRAGGAGAAVHGDRRGDPPTSHHERGRALRHQCGPHDAAPPRGVEPADDRARLHLHQRHARRVVRLAACRGQGARRHAQ